MPSPAFVSDVGKVLIDFDFAPAARRLAEKCPHPAETVLTLFDSIKGPYEDGRIDDEAFVREGIRLTGFTGTAQEFITIWCEIFTENLPMKTSLDAIAGKVPMYLLSNTSGLHKDYFWRTYGIFAPFSDGVYSHEARCSKPGEEIFRHTIENSAWTRPGLFMSMTCCQTSKRPHGSVFGLFTTPWPDIPNLRLPWQIGSRNRASVDASVSPS